jgi:plastocyanin
MLGSALLVLIGVGAIGAAEGATIKIVVKQGAQEFTPQQITIKVGDGVRWVNEDQTEHTLISATPSSRQAAVDAEDLFINTLLDPGFNYTYTFGEAGTYYYFCASHMQMWGVVVVEK